MYYQEWNCTASLFTKQNYNVISLNSHTHMSHISVRVYIFPGSACLFCWSQKYVDRSWEHIIRSQAHEYRDWDWGRAIPRNGIHKWDFRCSVEGDIEPFLVAPLATAVTAAASTEDAKSVAVREFLINFWGLGTEKEKCCRTCPPGYIGWRNWFLGIDSWDPKKFKNSGSEPVFVTV